MAEHEVEDGWRGSPVAASNESGSPGGGALQWVTVDGPLGVQQEEALKLARNFFYAGFCLLPWLWFLNCFYFWPVLRQRESDPLIRPWEPGGTRDNFDDSLRNWPWRSWGRVYFCIPSVIGVVATVSTVDSVVAWKQFSFSHRASLTPFLWCVSESHVYHHYVQDQEFVGKRGSIY